MDKMAFFGTGCYTIVIFGLILVLFTTDSISGANTTTLTLTISHHNSPYTFTELLAVSGTSGINTDSSLETKTIMEIVASTNGLDYHSSTSMDTLNIKQTKLVFLNQYEEQLLVLNNCNFTSTPHTCEDDSGKVLYFNKLNEYNDLVMVPLTSTPAMAEIVSLRYNRYFSTPSVGNLILIGGGNLETTAHMGCKVVGNATSLISTTANRTLDGCIAACSLNNSTYATIGSNSPVNCKCGNDINHIGTDASTGSCDSTCTDNTNQICGGSSAENAFSVTAFKTFHAQIMEASLGGKIAGSINITSDNNISEIYFGSEKTVLSLMIIEEEECYLTNLYFNASSPGYYAYYGYLTSGMDTQKRLKTTSGDYELYPSDDRIDIGYVKADCIWIQPIAHNYTFHRAAITVYVKEANAYGAVQYMALQVELNDEESSSIIPSSTILATSSTLDSYITVTAPSSLCSSSLSISDSSIVVSTLTTVYDDITTSNIDSVISTWSDDITLSTQQPGDITSTTADEEISSLVPSSTLSETSSTLNSSPFDSAMLTSNDINSLSTQNAADTISPTPVPIQSTIGPTTNIDPSPSTSSACSCLCRKDDGKNITEEERAQERVEEIKKKLILGTEKLSATVRKKISAEDNRPSAQGVGFIGVFFLAIVFSSLVLLDLTSLGQHLSVMKNNIMGGRANDAP